MESIKKYLRIDRREICFAKFIFEACEGIAQMTTIDHKKGIIVLIVPPGCMDDVDMILNDLKEQIMIEDAPIASIKQISNPV